LSFPIAPSRRGPALLGALSALLCVAPATAEARFGDRTLHTGKRGHDVRVLQSWLSKAGFEVTVDGAFGRRTRAALRAWERRHDRRGNGRLSRSDARLLRRQIEHGGGRGSAAPQEEPAPTGEAKLSEDGRTAIAPADAPPQVRAAIAAANKITRKPYRFGGGHADFADDGYDCSGAVSVVLHGAGKLDTPMDSSGLEGYGRSGRGRWITVYAHGSHAFVVVAGLRFDTSGDGEEGPRWRPESRSGDGYTIRHPRGL
jgi:cell wall-associated NlpC family hydrolase